MLDDFRKLVPRGGTEPGTPGRIRADAAARAERLADKSLYHTVAEVTPAGEGPAFVGLKPTGLDISLPDGLTLHYDLEGRLTRAATPNVQWRRGLSHRTLWLRKRSQEEGGGLESRVLDQRLSDQLAEETSARARAACDAFRAGRRWPRLAGSESAAPVELERLLSRAAQFDARGAHTDWERFRQVYGDIPILPPDQYGALVLLATEGCSYNQCTFCGFYRGVPFRTKSVEQFAAHVRAAVAYHGAALAARRSSFLGQANALTGPREWREAILRELNETFEFPAAAARSSSSWWAGSPLRMAAVASFIDVFSGRQMSVAEFAGLRELNLKQVYFGIETGDRQLLSWLKKPATPAQMIAAVTAAKQAGLQVGVIVLMGAGGEPFFESHVTETARLIAAMALGRGDYVYLSPLVDMPETEYAQRAAVKGLAPLSPQRMAEQEQLLRAALPAGPRAERPFVARYDVSQFVY